MTEVIYRNTPPDWHPGDTVCLLGCRGVWREISTHNAPRGWGWQCDRRDCPKPAVIEPRKERAA